MKKWLLFAFFKTFSRGFGYEASDHGFGSQR